MTVNPKTISIDEYAIRALNMMRNHNITQLVVMDEGKIAGFIHIHDLMKEGIV
jgi:arabinose-5-phosphate isomerase